MDRFIFLNLEASAKIVNGFLISMKSNKANWLEMISIYDYTNGYTLKYTKKRSDYTLGKTKYPWRILKSSIA